nr:hypothetical protein Itr_chr08CG20870 [Ipomoea trifida]
MEDHKMVGQLVPFEAQNIRNLSKSGSYLHAYSATHLFYAVSNYVGSSHYSDPCDSATSTPSRHGVSY